MSLKIDRVQLEIVIKNDQSRKRLRELEDQSRQLKKELKKLPEGTEAWTQKFNQLKKVQTEMDGVIDKIGLTGLSMKELSQRQKELNSIMRNLDPRTEEYKKLDTQLHKVKLRMNELRLGANRTKISLRQMADTMNRFSVMAASVIAAITGIVYSVAQLVKGTVDLDDTLANVMKTTGLTRKEVRELYSDFRYLNTRTARKELLALAEEAGRLGKKGKEDIMAFVEVGNKIKTALGDDLGDSADKAILEVGKITTLLNVAEQQSVSYGRAMDMVGSSINELAANSMAQAPYLINFTKRTMGLGKSAKMTASELVGMAATFDEAGQNLELSATAVNKIVIDMFRDYADYAEVAGMKSQDFFELLQTDANEAFIKLLEGLKGNNDGLATMVKKFDAIDVDGARATQALSALALKVDRLKRNQVLANEALTEGTSLTAEYNIKNNNLAGSYEKLGRFIRAKFINSSFLGWLEKVIGKMSEWTVVPLSDKLRKDKLDINGLVIEMTSLNTSNDRRNTIYKELGKIYPGIIKGIDQENINVKKLSENLAEYNRHMIAKIALQVSAEEMAEKASAVGKKEGEIEAYDIKLSQLTSIHAAAIGKYDMEAMKEAQEIALSNLDTEEKFNKVLYLRAQAEAKATGLKVAENKNASSKLSELREELKSLNTEYDKSFDHYREMESRIMGITSGIGKQNPKTENKGSSAASNSDPSTAPKETFNPKNLGNSEIQQIILLSNQKIQAYKDANAQEIEQLEANYNREETIRKTEYNKRFRLLKGDQKAQKELTEKFHEEELRQKTEHLVILTTVLENQLKNGIGLEGAILSDEENAKLQTKLDELKLALSEIGIELNNLGGDESNNGESGGGLGKITEKIQKAAALASTITNAIGGIFSALSAQENAEMEQYEINMDKRKKLLENQLENGALSQEDYNARVNKLDEDTDKKRRELANEQAKRDKTMAIFGAMISTAQAVASALTVQPAPLGIALAAIVGALGLYQIGVISKTKVPQYNQGNYLDVIGQDDGKSYRAKIGTNETQLVKEPTFIPGLGLTGEGSKPRELVFSGDDTQKILNTPALIDAINYTIRTPQFSQGNYSNTVTNNTYEKTFTDPAMIAGMNKFSAAVDRLYNDGLTLAWSDIDKKNKQMDALKEMSIIQ